ncbi:signal peptidase I [Candidatus Poribacteria bacterium]|nr:signal peptidase I [Candidatus Poribacteria bacterium]
MKINQNLMLIILAVIAVLTITAASLRLIFFDILIINGDSMFPTIRTGDVVLSNKIVYKYEDLKHGDIIAFKVSIKRLVKRIIGISGDTVELKNGIIYINGDRIQNNIFYITEKAKKKSFGPHIVRQNHVFVLGDNISISIDSRNFGEIPYDDVIGKADYICYPPDRAGKIQHWE